MEWPGVVAAYEGLKAHVEASLAADKKATIQSAFTKQRIAGHTAALEAATAQAQAFFASMAKVEAYKAAHKANHAKAKAERAAAKAASAAKPMPEAEAAERIAAGIDEQLDDDMPPLEHDAGASSSESDEAAADSD
jgi:hypothetical protein